MQTNKIIEQKIEYWQENHDKFIDMLREWLNKHNKTLLLSEETVYDDYLSLGTRVVRSYEISLDDSVTEWLDDNLQHGVYCNIVKYACYELEITQKELAEKLGVDDGTVRKWASGATKTPEWAEKFITLIIKHEKNEKTLSAFKYFLNSVGVSKTDG